MLSRHFSDLFPVLPTVHFPSRYLSHFLPPLLLVIFMCHLRSCLLHCAVSSTSCLPSLTSTLFFLVLVFWIAAVSFPLRFCFNFRLFRYFGIYLSCLRSLSIFLFTVNFTASSVLLNFLSPPRYVLPADLSLRCLVLSCLIFCLLIIFLLTVKSLCLLSQSCLIIFLLLGMFIF